MTFKSENIQEEMSDDDGGGVGVKNIQDDKISKQKNNFEFFVTNNQVTTEQQGCEAYEFLSQIFVQKDKIELTDYKKQKFWQKITKKI